MKIVHLPDPLHEYLVHVVEKYAASGIHPEEGIAVARLYEAVTKLVTHIPDAEIKKMAASATPQGQSKIVVEQGITIPATDPDREETNRVRAEAGGQLPADHWDHNVHPEDR
jgi:hypothetical protein